MGLTEDVQYAEQFWMGNGEHLLLRLARENVPFCTVPLPFADVQESICGISFHQIRYRKKRKYEDDSVSPVKTRWMTNKGLKKKWDLMCGCTWTFSPLKIEPRKQSVASVDQRYVYLVHIVKYVFNEKPVVQYISRIETGWDGTLLKEQVLEGDKKRPFPIYIPEADGS